MNSEKERILKMLEEGKINAEEAYHLLTGIDRKKTKKEARSLRIKVESKGEENVNIKIPLGLTRKLINIGGKLVSRFSPRTQKKLEKFDIDIDEILQSIDEELDLGAEPLKLVDLEEGNDKIKIWIE
ncbi:MAG: hypothetical protein U9N06_06090 [candidate division WOR-3 bacterium]|nr:hypothetical protein [candidate division WOR-3 bacterium]